MLVEQRVEKKGDFSETYLCIILYVCVCVLKAQGQVNCLKMLEDGAETVQTADPCSLRLLAATPKVKVEFHET